MLSSALEPLKESDMANMKQFWKEWGYMCRVVGKRHTRTYVGTPKFHYGALSRTQQIKWLD